MDWSLSFLGLYNYDSGLFDELTLPSGVSKEAVINNLMMSTNTLSVVYPNPGTLKTALGMFSEMMMPSWQRAFDALQIQYQALYNIDITETDTRTPNLTRTRTPDLETVRTPNLTSSGKNGGSDSTTTQVAAFNGNQLADREKQTTTLGTTNTVTTSGTEKTTETGNDVTTESGTDTTERTRTGYQGRDPQQSIQAEIDLARNNIVEMIVQDIKCNFCIMVY